MSAPSVMLLHPDQAMETTWYLVDLHTATNRTFGVVYASYTGGALDTCPKTPDLQWAVVADVDNNQLYQQTRLGNTITSTVGAPFFFGDSTWSSKQLPSRPWTRQQLKLSTLDFSLALSTDWSMSQFQRMGFGGVATPNASCLFSHVEMPRIKVQGTLALTNQPTPVTVVGTMRYQKMFGTFNASSAAGHLWYSVDLSNGYSLQVVQLLQPERNMSYANLITPGGTSNQVFGWLDFNVTSSDPWTSPNTGKVYNTTSRIQVPSYSIDLTVRTL